jgi:hypothetical protein
VGRQINKNVVFCLKKAEKNNLQVDENLGMIFYSTEKNS